MVIGIFTDTYYPDVNGVSSACQTLVKALKDNGHTVYVVTNTTESSMVIEQDYIIRIPGVAAKKLYNYTFTGIFSTPAYKFLKKIDFDVIHIQTEVGVGIFGRIVAKNWNIPLIYTYHTMYEDYTYYVTKNHKGFDKTIKKILEGVTRLFIDSTTCITTTSMKAKNALVRYGVRSYIDVVPNGINFSNFNREKYTQEEIDKFKREHHLEHKIILLCLGRIAKEKSYDTILLGLRKYLDHDEYSKDIHLLFVGDGPYADTIKEMVKLLDLSDYVTFLGRIPYADTPFYYSVSDIFLSASVSETQGLTYSEAMACQTLVFCAYDTNLKDVVIDNKTGFFFYNLDSFVSRLHYIVTLNQKEREKILKFAKKHNDEMFSIQTYANRMEKVYLKAMRFYW